MLESIVTALLPFALKLIGAFFKNNEEKKNSKKKFMEFLDAMSRESDRGSKLRKSYDEQYRRLLDGDK